MKNGQSILDLSIKIFYIKQNITEQATQYTLSSLLIMPVQRIPRYALLLTELIKLTNEGHPDLENLRKAEKLVKEIAGSLNEFIKDAEGRNKVLSISNSLVGLKQNLIEPHRRFIKQGPLKKITSRMVQTCYLFLFNDLIVYSHRQILNNFQYNGTIDLGPSWVRDLEDSDKVKNIFQIVGVKKTWTFYTDTPEKKIEWQRDINYCINELITKNPALINQRAKVNVKDTNFLSMSFAPTDYDNELKHEREQNAMEKKKKGSTNSDENEPLLGSKTKEKSCCTII